MNGSRNWNITQWGTHIFVFIYLFKPDKLAREQSVWNVGWEDEEEGKQDKFKWML
jgi:hypothetical protein